MTHLQRNDFRVSSHKRRVVWMAIVAVVGAIGCFAPARAARIAVGLSHGCVLTSSGGAECWGWNGGGQIGGGDWIYRVARPVAGLSESIVDVAGGFAHSCAVTATGAVLCWGGNFSGELGRDTGNQVIGNAPGVVDGLSAGIARISSSRGHTCALTSLGNVKCWGLNDSGQLGNGQGGPDEFSASPVDVPLGPNVGLLPVQAISAGSSHACAIDGIGGVRCWGYNGQGQGGKDPGGSEFIFPSAQTPPSLVTFGVNAKQVAAGGFHTCALLETGAVRCWGWNGEGELGNGQSGAASSSFAPVPVAGLDGSVQAVQLTTGEFHSCVLLESNDVRCWGSNNWGQLGDGTTVTRPVPTSVVGLPSGEIEAVVAGYDFSCARYASGDVYCWGDDRNGELGRGVEVVRPSPSVVVGLPERTVNIEGGNVHVCALGEQGSVSCWGRNHDGQIGDGTATDRAFPVPVSGFAQQPAFLASSGFHTCISSLGGSVQCWGYNAYGFLENPVTGHAVTSPSPAHVFAPAPTQLEAGSLGQNCALVAGSLQCWGARFGTQISGAPTVNTVPYSVSFNSQIDRFALGEEHGCLLTDAGTVWCWGNNHSDQFGIPLSPDISLAPLQAHNVGAAVGLAAGRWHSCAVERDGAVRCWGGNSYDTLGDGQVDGGLGSSSAMPVVVAGFDGSDDDSKGSGLIASSARHTCALNRKNVVKCWGLADSGQIGAGSLVNGMLPSTAPISTPVDLDIGPIVDLVTGSGYSCALGSTGVVACWGDNTFGQLGNGQMGYSGIPALVRHPIFASGFELTLPYLPKKKSVQPELPAPRRSADLGPSEKTRVSALRRTSLAGRLKGHLDYARLPR